MSAVAITSQPPVAKRATLPRFVMIGGFLGAGKTTAAARLGAHLKKLGRRVAFITNDEGSTQVDALVLRAMGFATEHVDGGSFASRLDSLTKAGARLADSGGADVIIAEPVGSCADVVATVGNPLRRLSEYAVAPFTVVVDAVRGARLFKLEAGAGFSEKIQYIYRKQLEEADVILINKTDLISVSALGALTNRLGAEFAGARILEASARSGAGIENWAGVVMEGSGGLRPAVQMDYQAYGDGEALLGWLDCSVQLSAIRGFEANPILQELGDTIRERLRGKAIEIAHLKMALVPEVDMDGAATLNVVRNDEAADFGEELAEPVERGTLSLSLRAEGKPDVLLATVTDAMTHVWGVFPEVFARLTHMEHFRPGRPDPAHRLISI